MYFPHLVPGPLYLEVVRRELLYDHDFFRDSTQITKADHL